LNARVCRSREQAAEVERVDAPRGISGTVRAHYLRPFVRLMKTLERNWALAAVLMVLAMILLGDFKR
jgi:hypothetical protein